MLRFTGVVWVPSGALNRRRKLRSPVVAQEEDRWSSFNVGDRVQSRYRAWRRGVVVAIAPGCNGGPVVRFDGDDWDVQLPARDLIREEA